ncbi:MAG: hypothetical protein SPI06_10810 [Terrisporobacter sp.]|uniref:hypothetical protein n=1 Tax=Terrisporobacter sp. TaxID=1965305 RepID=UPI002A913252|nr:hypothetical protein [Terrisporobacter sp.]MDY6153888.1 hypothetical protein [Terrisporobacter sp.]
MEKTYFDGNLIELSSDNNQDLKMKVLVCPLNQLNLNGVGISQEDTTYEEQVGLQGQPVQCKLIEKYGQTRFGSHEATEEQVRDENGKLTKKYKFGTVSVGYHPKVYIENLKIDNIPTPCIVAECVVWSRYPKVIDTIKRIGTDLRTSWEISYNKYRIGDEGGKWISGLHWLGNCLLGVRPAYDSAGVLELSEESQEAQISNALQEDINAISINDNNLQEGGIVVSKTAQDNVAQLEEISGNLEQQMIENKENEKIKESEDNKEKVEEDSNCKKEKAEKVEDKKEEKPAKEEKAKKEEETKDKKEDVSKQEKEEETKDKKEVSELKVKIAELENTIKEQNEKMALLSEAVISKEAEISELKPYKAEVEKINKEKAEKEFAEKKENLKNKYLENNILSEKDFEVSEIKEAIEKLDENAIKIYVAEKIINGEMPMTNVSVSEANVETNLEDNQNSEITGDTFSKIFRKQY